MKYWNLFLTLHVALSLLILAGFALALKTPPLFLDFNFLRSALLSLGRLHPLFVNILIGALLFYCMLEAGFFALKSKFEWFFPALLLLVDFSLITGLVSQIIEYYPNELIYEHAFSGLGVWVLLHFYFFIKSRVHIKEFSFLRVPLLAFLVVASLLTGHLGGVVRMGENFWVFITH